MRVANKKEYCIELRESLSGLNHLLGFEIIFETEKNATERARKLKKDYLTKGHKNVSYKVFENRSYNYLIKN